VRDLLLVTKVDFTRASPSDVEKGLLGFVTLQLGETVELGGIALRRTEAGEFELSFPVRTDRRGRRHRVHRILDEEERLAVQVQVVGILRARGAVR